MEYSSYFSIKVYNEMREMTSNMEKINKKTITFAQNGDMYLLSNRQDITLDNVDIINDKGWLVNMFTECISPYLSISVLTKQDAEWGLPDRQIDVEEIKHFYKCL